MLATIWISRPSRIHETPRPMTINQWNLVHGNRSIRAGTRLRTTPGVSAVADDIGTLPDVFFVVVPDQLPQDGPIHSSPARGGTSGPIRTSPREAQETIQRRRVGRDGDLIAEEPAFLPAVLRPHDSPEE